MSDANCPNCGSIDTIRHSKAVPLYTCKNCKCVWNKDMRRPPGEAVAPLYAPTMALLEDAAPPSPPVDERADMPWKELFWQVANALNCLPSTFVDANEHVLKAARSRLPVAVPDTHVMVPRVPTEKMIAAAGLVPFYSPQEVLEKISNVIAAAQEQTT